VIDSQDDRRRSLVRGLIQGTLPPAEAAATARANGLLPGGRYRAIRARPGGSVQPFALARAVAATGGGADGRGAVATVIEGDVVGIVTSAPDVPAGAVAGLGAVVPLAGLDSSFRLATRALETAIAYGIEGAVDIDELSLRPAILTEPQLGERMVGRYLDPLRPLGAFGDTLQRTVHEYLASGLRVHRTAEVLYIHPNTLRYRLEKFEEITRADLRRMQDLLELWWALERRKLDVALNRSESE